MTKLNTREKILLVADDLFYQEGIRAVGVDTIIAKSEVAKTTLYRYFPSKDDLVVAYLKRRDRLFWELLEEELKPYSDDSWQRLVATFSWIDSLLDNKENHGCPFLTVASEFPNLDYPGHQVATVHKEKMRSHIEKLVKQVGIETADELSAALLLLVDGAFIERRLFNQKNNGVSLEKAATIMINSYLNS